VSTTSDTRVLVKQDAFRLAASLIPGWTKAGGSPNITKIANELQHDPAVVSRYLSRKRGCSGAFIGDILRRLPDPWTFDVIFEVCTGGAVESNRDEDELEGDAEQDVA
jgi:hypothetical protein